MIRKIINYFDITPDTGSKTEQFCDKLRELISILFAVVLGVGFAELGDVVFWSFDFYVLSLAYLAIFLSWWGYNLGTIMGPGETNRLNYWIDVSLLTVYCLLIYKRDVLSDVLLLYFGMYLLYFLWEAIRMCNSRLSATSIHKIKKALICNGVFTALFLFFFINKLCYPYVDILKGKIVLPQINDGLYLIAVFVLLIVYRMCIRQIYRHHDLSGDESSELTKQEIEQLCRDAELVAQKAKAHLSQFKVGAVILSNEGNKYRGCNIEFDNYSNTIHAEESAISSFAVSDDKSIKAIAVFTDAKDLCYPCGMCRQSLIEIGGGNLFVIACNPNKYEIKTMEDLLPEGFTLKD